MAGKRQLLATLLFAFLTSQAFAGSTEISLFGINDGTWFNDQDHTGIVGRTGISRLFGINDGTWFNDQDHTGIVGIKLYHGWVVDGIQVTYDDNGKVTTKPFHGTPTQFTELKFAYPKEHLVKVKGKYGPYPEKRNKVTVTELTFVTYNEITKKTIEYGPFGGYYGDRPDQISFETRDGVNNIGGIFGYSSDEDYLRGIGFIFNLP